MDSSRQDDLVRTILAPLARVEAVTLEGRGRHRHRRTVLSLTITAATILLAGAAIASGIGRFPGISAADHPARPGDTPGPAVVDQLRVDELPGGRPFDQIGTRRIDAARCRAAGWSISFRRARA